jgi:hypothetical protein
MRLGTRTQVLLIAAVGCALTLSSSVVGAVSLHESPRGGLTQAQWRGKIVLLPTPSTGCYIATYPHVIWKKNKCHTPILAPGSPAHLTRPHALGSKVGGGIDYEAYVGAGRYVIHWAGGEFRNVSPKIHIKSMTPEQGATLVPGAYLMQLDTNGFTTPVCGKSNTSCFGWQKFFYDEVQNSVYIQYWLMFYGTCPAGWTANGTDCFENSQASSLQGPPATPSELKNSRLAATVNARGTDTVIFAVNGGATAETNAPVTARDSVLQLGPKWTTTEFGVYGDFENNEAIFGTNEHLTLVTQLKTNGPNPVAPACIPSSNETVFTGETNNLQLARTSALTPGPYATMASTESDGTVSSQSCWKGT